MSIHIKYLRYILRHKWYVFKECCKRGIIWRGIMHDISKISPDEWFPYARYFYGKYPKWEDLPAFAKEYFNPLTEDRVEREFNLAWLKHIHRNDHHWQWYILREDSGTVKCLEMPYDSVLEMVSDWIGAGKAQGNGDDVVNWYFVHEDKMNLHESTRNLVEKLIGFSDE